MPISQQNTNERGIPSHFKLRTQSVKFEMIRPPFIFLIFGLVLMIPKQANAYLGPGAGFALFGSFLAIFSTIVAIIFSVFIWPMRCLFRIIRCWTSNSKCRVKRLVILGLDGMDPALAEKFMATGTLPNFAKLREQGCFKSLATTTPAISPVAWSSFQTGCNPGKHNIYDFLTRDKHTYLPKLSSVEIQSPKRALKLGRYRIPLGKATIRTMRKSLPFWHYLGKKNIFCNIIRVPITFPAEKIHGAMLSGMCVPDIKGSQGTFSFYTTQTNTLQTVTQGETFGVERNKDVIKAYLTGPLNPFRNDPVQMKCPFTVKIHNGNNSYDATFKINGDTYRLKRGTYSPWISAAFRTGLGIKIRGICRVWLLSTEPDFAMYVSPIHLDPEKPAMPISHPRIYSNYLAKRQGKFATLGLAEDTWALNAGLLSDQAFIQQCQQNDTERETMFLDALDKVKQGLIVCVFDGTDRIQHTFWRYLDKQHPFHQDDCYDPGMSPIETCYRRMDALVGRTMAECNDRNTLLMVISDHGFNTFRYGVDLNRWLEENGYLKVHNEGRNKKYLQGIDWSHTRAYALGLAGIYLNLEGREVKGIVDPGAEEVKLRNELMEKLTNLFDTKQKQNAVVRVYDAQETYHGPYAAEAPDLVVGYNVGYRAAWQTSTGQVTEQVFHDNKRAWSGDHCIDPDLVPGVFFCNRQVHADQIRIIDIAPTVLKMFGLTIPLHMDGQPLEINLPTKHQTQDSGKDCRKQ